MRALGSGDNSMRGRAQSMEELPTSVGSSDHTQNRGLRNLAAFTQITASNFPSSSGFGPLGAGTVLLNNTKAGEFHTLNHPYSLTSSGSSTDRRDSSSVDSGIDGPDKLFEGD